MRLSCRGTRALHGLCCQTPRRSARAATSSLRNFSTGSHMLAHPSKRKHGLPGEDAYFIHDAGGVVVIGVADGTSVADGGGYANRLMEATSAVAAAAMPRADSASLGTTSAAILQGGWEAARTLQPPIEGRSTGCVVTVERKAATGGSILNATVLGDSGFMVLSPPGQGPQDAGWSVRYTCDEERIEEQQHYFNCPFQLGSLGGGEMNTPADAFHASIALEHGDVVIVATDGLFDTLFDEDIVNMFDDKLGDPRIPLDDAAEELALAAQFAGAYGSPCRAIDEDGAERLTGRVGDTPFGLRAKEEGFISRPGEAIDDVAVAIIRLD